MSELLARFFRWNNSKLITSGSSITEKLHKIVFIVSVLIYRALMPRLPDKQCPVTIGNFDTDLKLRVDRCRAMGSALFWTGFHEFREFQFLHRHLRTDMVFVDVGANQGEYTLFAAKRVSNGSVF